MARTLQKQQIFWAPTLETARNIDNSDTVLAIEAARHRFNASMRDLENAFDAKASELRAAFVAEVSEHVGSAEGRPTHGPASRSATLFKEEG